MNALVRKLDLAPVLLPIEQVFPDPNQPRVKFDQAELRDLAASIKKEGLKQPIKVRPRAEGGYWIIFGERRYRAHKINGEKFIVAYIFTGELSPADILIEQIIENDQRADVRPIDEARKFKQLLDEGMSIETLAERLGRQEWRIEERVRLLDLEPNILKLYEAGQLPQEAASEISRIKDHAQQTKLVQMVSFGKLKGYKAIRTAVDTILNGVTASDLFGESAPKPSEEDMRTVSRMERKIEEVKAMVASGWKNGECVVATKVAPDRARLMAEQLACIRSAIFTMENDLRGAAAQAEIVLAVA